MKIFNVGFWQYLIVFGKADRLVSQERFKEAISVIEKFLEKKVYANEAIYYLLGIAHYNVQNYDLAKESFEFSIENNKYENNDKANTYFYLGLSQYDDGKYRDSIKSFQTAIKVKSSCSNSNDNVINMPDLHCYLGRAYKNNEETQEAFRVFNEGLKYDPNNEALQRELTLLGIG